MIDKMELSNKASIIRKELGEDDASPIDIFALAQTIERLTLVFYPLGKNISGACFKNPWSFVIAINSEMSIGRQRYSMAHELYHLFFDKEMSSIICASRIGGDTENERKADQFASYFLMPPAALYENIRNCKQRSQGRLTLREIIRLEQYFGVSHQAMLIRLQEENELSAAEAASMQIGIIALATRMGFDTALYQPSQENKRMRVFGHYIYQADKLLQGEIISNAKYEELLLDAFRDDIVFGEETEGGDMID